MYDEKLGQLFNFTRDDLEANRAGQLSDVQTRRFVDGNQSCLFWAVLITGAFALMTSLAFFGPFDAPSDLPPTLLIFTVISLVGLAIAWFTRNDTFYLYDISGTGQLTIDMGKSTRHTLNINGYVFVLTTEQYNYLEHGADYHVYYATKETDTGKLKTATKLIQSIERKM